jgi:hypothetical protein
MSLVNGDGSSASSGSETKKDGGPAEESKKSDDQRLQELDSNINKLYGVVKQWEKEKERRKALNGAPDVDYVRPNFTKEEEDLIDKYFKSNDNENVREANMYNDLADAEMNRDQIQLSIDERAGRNNTKLKEKIQKI